MKMAARYGQVAAFEKHRYVGGTQQDYDDAGGQILQVGNEKITLREAEIQVEQRKQQHPERRVAEQRPDCSDDNPDSPGMFEYVNRQDLTAEPDERIQQHVADTQP